MRVRYGSREDLVAAIENLTGLKMVPDASGYTTYSEYVEPWRLESPTRITVLQLTLVQIPNTQTWAIGSLTRKSFLSRSSFFNVFNYGTGPTTTEEEFVKALESLAGLKLVRDEWLSGTTTQGASESSYFLATLTGFAIAGVTLSKYTIAGTGKWEISGGHWIWSEKNPIPSLEAHLKDWLL